MINLSIIIPVYNSSKEIKKCIKSIETQTYSNYEIILINDGSTDNSLKIIKELSKNNSKIKVYDQKNSGVSVTRNNGIKYASGKYIMFVDNDDYFNSDTFLEEYMKKIENSNVDILIGSYVRHDENGNEIFRQKINTNSSWSKFVEVTPWARVFKKEFLIKNKIQFKSMPIGEDIYFNFMAYYRTNKIDYIENYDYVWFYNTKSVSNSKQKGFKDNINIYDLLNDLKLVSDNSDELFRYFVKRYTIWYLLFAGKDATKEKFILENNKINKWLKENGFNKTISPFSLKIKGEGIKNRIAVFIMRCVNIFHLTNIFATIYCKGSEQHED